MRDASTGSKLRIQLWAGGFPPAVGGLERLTESLVRALGRRGHAVLVFAPALAEDPGTPHPEAGVSVLRLPFAEALAARDPAALGALRGQVVERTRDFAPDLVHLHGFHPNFLLHPETRSAHPSPYVFTLHSVPALGFAPGSLARRLLAEADRVTTCSAAVRNEILGRAPEISERACVIYNGSEVPEFEPSALCFEAPQLLGLGRLAHEKGFDLALEAFAIVAGRFPEARFTLVGDGPERAALERQTATLGLAHRVRFLGELPASEVPKQIEAATLLVVPSRREAFGLAALEAAFHGRPVVASDVGGLGETLGAGAAGVLVPPEDPEALAAAIDGLLADPERSRALGRSARAHAHQEFGWDRCVDAYESLYHELITVRKSA